MSQDVKLRQEFPATLLCDFYKLSHPGQYPAPTDMIFSTWTPRSNKHFPETDYAVAFGSQAVCKIFLINYFQDNFFSRPVEDVCGEFKRVVKYCLFVENPDDTRIRELHALGFLPIEVRAIPEGTKVPFRTPIMSIFNTQKKFFWVTNSLETLISTEGWQAPTSATIACQYRTILDKYAMLTVGNTDFVPFQGHDFSMRGMGGITSGANSGSGHLLPFVGTDTIPAILHLEYYYNADMEKELIGCSIPATEHSVMCALIFYIKRKLEAGETFCGISLADYPDRESRLVAELCAVKYLITVVHPTGMVSIVCDTFDLWEVISFILPELKDVIMGRDGKLVIRPDSGDPVDIVAGTVKYMNQTDYINSDAIVNVTNKGLIESLWDIFGGDVSDQGYRILDSHIGAIYGEAINLERCESICNQLMIKQFASINLVYGIGSYTYQYNTRDTLGFAIKSTLCSIDGDEYQIFKDPATDDGTKKSATGNVAVIDGPEGIYHVDGLSLYEKVDGDMFRPILRDGAMLVDDDLSIIKARLNG